MNKEKEEMKDEIRKEFQLERMVLFSDAVFAIAITLMAIEIKLPDTEGIVKPEVHYTQIMNVIPKIFAYTLSFFFIGNIWYRHLKIFSLLKDYDGGLIVRNLIMLFFIGFFPFSASLVTNVTGGFYISIGIYFLIVMACQISQLVLIHYILIKRPNLRINCNIYKDLHSYKLSKLVVIMMVIIFGLIAISNYLIQDPFYKPFIWWWFIPFPFLMKYFKKRIK